MLRRVSALVSTRSLALGILVLLPLIPLALLCLGRSPSRFDTVNLPAWERHAPTPTPRRFQYALPPAAPGAIVFAPNPWTAALRKSPDPKSVGDEGAWLEAACVWGRTDPALAAKQDRIATRLLASQNDAGWLGSGDKDRPLTPTQWNAQGPGLRGLLAWYALTRNTPAIYAALSLGSRALTRLDTRPDPAWAAPLARLSAETGDTRFLHAARRLVSAQDGLAWCALFEATGDTDSLSTAERAWAAAPSAPNSPAPASPALAAELLLLTGRPGYARALAAAPPSGPALARMAWTRAPQGMAVQTALPCAASFRAVHLAQTADKTGTRTITVSVSQPTAFKLRVFLPPGPPVHVLLNGKPQIVAAPPGGYMVLLRRWRNGDAVTVIPGTGSADLLVNGKSRSATQDQGHECCSCFLSRGATFSVC